MISGMTSVANSSDRSMPRYSRDWSSEYTPGPPFAHIRSRAVSFFSSVAVFFALSASARSRALSARCSASSTTSGSAPTSRAASAAASVLAASAAAKRALVASFFAFRAAFTESGMKAPRSWSEAPKVWAVALLLLLSSEEVRGLATTMRWRKSLTRAPLWVVLRLATRVSQRKSQAAFLTSSTPRSVTLDISRTGAR